MVVEGATGQHLKSKNEQFRVPSPQAEQLKLEQQQGWVDWGQQGVIMAGSPEAWSKGSGPPRERKKDRKSTRLNSSHQ